MKIIRDGQGLSELTPIADSGGLGLSSTSAGSKQSLDVNIANSDVSIGGGTQYKETETAAAATGNVVLGIRSDNTLHGFSLDSSDYLNVNVQAGSTAGTEYAEGDTHGVATGLAIFGKRSDDSVQMIELTDNDFVKVNVENASSIGGGKQYTEADEDAAATGTVILGQRSDDSLRALTIDNNDYLNVNIQTDSVGIGGGTQYKEGTTAAAITGTVLLWEDATNVVQPISAARPLPVTGTFNVDGSTMAVTGGTIIATATDFDIRDIKASTDSITVSGAILSAIQSAIEGTVTVDNGGTFAVQEVNSTAILADTASMDTNLGTLAGAIAGSEMQVDVLTMPTITETNSTAILADTASMDTNLTTLAGAVAGSEIQVDVLTMPSTTVTATNLDIRDLAAGQDFVTVSGAVISAIQTAVEGTLVVDATGQGDVPITLAGEVIAASQSGTWDVGTLTTITNDVSIDDGGNSITVDASNLDIRNLQASTDSIMVSGSTLDDIKTAVEGSLTVAPGASWPVTNTVSHATFLCDANMQIADTDVGVGNPVPIEILAGTNAIGKLAANDGVDIGDVSINNTVTVSATDLDIRSLTAATDSVTISGTVLSAIQTASEVKGTPIDMNDVYASGIGFAADTAVAAAPGASNHYEIHHLKGSNHGGDIRFYLRDGSGGGEISQQTLSFSGGGFSEQFDPPLKLSSNTALYFDYVSNDYNPDVSITAHMTTVAD